MAPSQWQPTPKAILGVATKVRGAGLSCHVACSALGATEIICESLIVAYCAFSGAGNIGNWNEGAYNVGSCNKGELLSSLPSGPWYDFQTALGGLTPPNDALLMSWQHGPRHTADNSAKAKLRPTAVSTGAHNFGDSNTGEYNIGNNNAGSHLFGDFGRRWRLEDEW